jgi:hypothetical protein
LAQALKQHFSNPGETGVLRLSPNFLACLWLILTSPTMLLTMCGALVHLDDFELKKFSNRGRDNRQQLGSQFHFNALKVFEFSGSVYCIENAGSLVEVLLKNNFVFMRYRQHKMFSRHFLYILLFDSIRIYTHTYVGCTRPEFFQGETL